MGCFKGKPRSFQRRDKVTGALTALRAMSTLISREVFHYIINFGHYKQPK